MYAEEWRLTRTHDLTTAERIAAALRRHAYSAPANPGITLGGRSGDRQLSDADLAKRPSILQGWIAGLALDAVRARKPSSAREPGVHRGGR